MLKDGVISEVKQPTDWYAGMVILPKKNSEMRICVYCTLGCAWVKHDKHSLSHVDNLLGQLTGAKHFTKLDA